jgi:fibronectin-binding autotransporter adhesin
MRNIHSFVKSLKTLLSLAALVLAAILPGAPAHAATHTWNGGGANELWSTAANWTGGAPTAGEAAPVILIFPNGVITTNNIVGLIVDGLRFTGADVTLHGSGGGTLIFRGAGGTNLLASGGSSYLIASTLPVTWNGSNYCNISLGSSVTFDCAIGGAGSVTFDNVGAVRYSGTSANTASGKVTVKDDVTMYLSKTAGLNAIADTAQVLLQAANQISDSATVSLKGVGELWLQGFNETLGDINLASGQITMGSGVLTLNGNITTTSAGGSIWGQLTLGGETRIIQVGESQSLTIWAVISNGGGAAGLTKNGVGQLSLRGANTFTGGVTVNDGTLDISNDGALGTTAGGVSVQESATMRLSSVNVGAEALTLAGNLDCSTTNTWGGSVTLQTGANFNCYTNSRTVLNGVVSGSTALLKSGPGSLVLAGSVANTYSGGTEVWNGTLLLSKTNVVAVPGALKFMDIAVTKEVRLVFSDQIANTAAVTLTNNSTLNLNNNAERIGSLAGNGNVALGTGLLTNGVANAFTTFSGIITGTGPTALVKTGNGTFTLTGTNTCSGACLVNQGTLTVNGTLPGAITVSSSSYLTGTGTVGQVTCNSAYLQPGGLDQGTLKTGSLAFNNSAAVAFFELGITTNDVVSVTGAVTLNNAILAFDSYTAGGIGKKFTLIANDGADAVSGTFNGLPEGATVPYGSLNYTISYVGGTGNDVVLTQTTQPASPQIRAITKQLNGQMVITGHGENGSPFEMQAITNLMSTNWVSLGAFYSDGFGNISFTDTNAASFKQRYYRFKMQ